MFKRLAQPVGMYGCFNVAAQYARMPYAIPPVGEWQKGSWQHGWIPRERNIDPDSIIGWDGKSLERRHIRYRVWREDQASALRNFGYSSVIAIGAPWVYLPRPVRKISRVPNSLLLMPQHSLAQDPFQWSGDEYADYVQTIRKDFERIVLCLHYACFQSGNWKKGFEKLGVPVVLGADHSADSIQRLAEMFSSFEYVSGNDFGSFVAYAAYFGAKASVSGPCPIVEKGLLEKHDFYRNRPDLMEKLEDISQVYRKNYHWLYVEPGEARTAEEWASQELGQSRKLSPQDLRREFGWSRVNAYAKLPWVLGKRVIGRPIKKLSRVLAGK